MTTVFVHATTRSTHYTPVVRKQYSCCEWLTRIWNRLCEILSSLCCCKRTPTPLTQKRVTQVAEPEMEWTVDVRDLELFKRCSFENQIEILSAYVTQGETVSEKRTECEARLDDFIAVAHPIIHNYIAEKWKESEPPTSFLSVVKSALDAFTTLK